MVKKNSNGSSANGFHSSNATLSLAGSDGVCYNYPTMLGLGDLGTGIGDLETVEAEKGK